MMNFNIANKNNVFIFDWDDTLYPTSWELAEFKKNIKNPEFYLSLDLLLSEFLTRMLEYGKIYIVSGAKYEWLIESMTKLPRTKFVLRGSNIISSASAISSNKKSSFDKIYELIKLDGIKNIVSIGDSDNEKMALISIRDQ